MSSKDDEAPMITRETHMGSAFGAARTLAATLLLSAPRRLLASLALEPLGYLATVFIAVLLKLVTDAAASSDMNLAGKISVAFPFTVGFMFLLQGMGARLRMDLDERVRLNVDTLLSRVAASIPTITLFDTPEVLDRLSLLREAKHELSQATGYVVVAIGHFTRLIASLGLLVTVSPELGALVVAGALPAVAEYFGHRKIAKSDLDAAGPDRLSASIVSKALSNGGVKEARIYQLSDALIERFERYSTDAFRTRQRGLIASASFGTAAWIGFGLAFVWSTSLVVTKAIQGTITAGDAVMAIYLAGTIAGHLSNVVWVAAAGASLVRVFRHYAELSKFSLRESSNYGSDIAPGAISGGITLRNVSFRHQGASRNAVDDVSLHLPAGTTVGIVGANGSGKSTLVNILLGLYRPNAGEVHIDDKSMYDLNPSTWKDRTSAAFQDYAKYEVSVREAVGLGAMGLDSQEDVASVSEALQAAGAVGLERDFENGLETQIGTAWGGVEPSEGQWQKLAVARAFVRRRPLVLALDEPNASLDTRTEKELYEAYRATVSKSGLKRNGGIALFVSHRLAAIGIADMIVVMSDGRVVEAGSHRELLERNGHYASLLRVQAQQYSQ